MSTVVIFDEYVQDITTISFDDSLEANNNDQVEQHGLSSDPDPDLMSLLRQTQSDALKIKENNLNLKAKLALLTKDLECYKFQLTNFENQEKREKSFEVAFQQSYNKGQNLEHQIRELTCSKNDSISKLEQQTYERKK